MKKFMLIVPLYLASGICHAQMGEWVWIHGPDTVNGLGNYGTQGVSDPTNNPPSFYQSCEWTDLNGDFWMYGGLWKANIEYGDLWKYNPASNQWTWMKGPGVANAFPNYG